MSELIGYLIGSGAGHYTVHCEECCKDKKIKIHKKDIFPYSQHCFLCKKELVKGESGYIDLFNGQF